MNRRTLLATATLAALCAPGWALGVTGQRSALMPDVPTIGEAGLPGYAFETWFKVFTPAATPRSIVDGLNATLATVLGTGAVKVRMTQDGFDPAPSTVADARRRLKAELPQWARLIEERGIAAE